MTAETPTIRLFDGRGIPDELKAQKRWAPWRAVLNEKKGKFDKIPHNPNRPEYGISTNNPEKWGSYDTALKAYQANTKLFAGVGYVMTNPHGVVGIDLDKCVVNGTVAPWAQEIVEKLDSYTEISPSGTGLRILAAGEIPEDWNNHDIGIEIYAGNEARFLTVTGEHVPGTPTDIRVPSADVFADLAKRFAKERKKADVIDLNMPDVLDDLLTPDVSSLELPYQVKDFLLEGRHSGDRSRAVFAAACALYSAGLPDDEVFSILASNDYAMEIALDHRRQDHDRALLYIWREHCCKGKARASELKALSDDDFEVLPPLDAGTTAAAPGEPPSELKKAAQAVRFQIQTAAQFLTRRPPQWIIKGVMPRAELMVVFGDSGSGKSFFVFDMLGAIARGTEWRGKKVTKGRAVYIAAEGAGGCRNRLKAYCDFHGVKPDELDIGIIPEAPNLMEKTDIKDLIVALRAFGKTDVIVVDTFAQSFQGNENSGEDVSRALAHCKALHRATGALVVLISHTGKDASRGVRGWSGLRGAADAQIEVIRNGEERAAVIDKQKDGSGEGDQFGFRLNIVEIDTDEDGEPITSCVIQAGDNKAASQVERTKKVSKGLGARQTEALATLQEITDTAGDGVTKAALIENCISKQKDQTKEGRDRYRESITRAINTLITNCKIVQIDNLLHEADE
ncbi:AAA domain containing protein [uncultured Caudovirales phage]|uniref:AAA domain containing protein n=1 Tax=uncultured Caudovirales phage TaxID=2100421 RepID=A0A6J5P7R5_9CAUD|nr:AAA domain containing protein [uncultured Caudovirales phage]